jgi:hypothetical protein
MSNNDGETLGVLWNCMERRFGQSQRDAFRESTGLEFTDFWNVSMAGGATKTRPADVRIAIDHGAKIIGLGAHGDGCGGNPGVDDAMLEDMLDKQIRQFHKDFSGLTVYALFSTLQGGTQVWRA